MRSGSVVAQRLGVRKILLATLGVCVAALLALMAGPVMSGAVFLLIPSPLAAMSARPSAVHVPIDKGHVDLSTGLYVRENDDLVVPGNPPIVLRRTHLAGYRTPCEFGLGTTHNGEIAVGGNTKEVTLRLANQARVDFRRITSGSSHLNAMFEAEPSPTEWDRARFGWTGTDWALKRQDGALARFRPCPSGGRCSITSFREPSGATLYYRRDSAGVLKRIDDGANRWIAFDYDDQIRITRAYDSRGREVRYGYDNAGRLVRVDRGDGVVLKYSYTDLDELATIEEPGTTIENVYENGRVVRQVNHYPGSERYIFRFDYRQRDGRMMATVSRRSDGTWTRYLWDSRGQPASETEGVEDIELGTFTYARNSITNKVESVTRSCRGAGGRWGRHSSIVTDGDVERVKQDLTLAHCADDY